MFDRMMFDYLPLHIREVIFSRVRYVDLFETARVSQGWWALTMASYERILHRNDDFLLDQVEFCSGMMAKEEPWLWWMLTEFTGSRKLFLEKDDFKAFNGDALRLLRYFKDKGINVQDLRIGKKTTSMKPFLQLPPSFNELFPGLTSLQLNGVAFAEGSTVLLPSKLEVLKLDPVGLPKKTNLSLLLFDLSKLKVMRLNAFGYDAYFDGRNCHNLTRLTINAAALTPNDPTKANHVLKSILNQNKGLKTVSMFSAKIDKEWLQMFPPNVDKLELEFPVLSLDLFELFGWNALLERMALIYIFEDWKSVVEFRSREMKWDKYMAEEDPYYTEEEEEAFRWSAAYKINYVCKPTANVEEIDVDRKSRDCRLNEAILSNNHGLVLTSLKFGGKDFPYSVPPTVRNLKVYWSQRALVLEDPSVLETLYETPQHHSVLDVDALSTMINLRTLELRNGDSRQLACILVSCTSLTELTLLTPELNVFKNIASNVQSVSVKRLMMRGGRDTFEDVLKHFPSLSILILESHCENAILQSDVNAVCHLQYFKIEVKSNKNVAVHMSSLDFPYMLFVCCNPVDIYAASKSKELLNEISVKASNNNLVKARRSSFLNSFWGLFKLSCVYSKNVATRFLRGSCPVVTTVHEFIAQHKSVEIEYRKKRFRLK